jgi:hypothetical protein
MEYAYPVATSTRPPPTDWVELARLHATVPPWFTEDDVATFELSPRWRIMDGGVYYGWLDWNPGLYSIYNKDGTLVEELPGPRSQQGRTMPANRIRRKVIAVLIPRRRLATTG